MNCAAGRRGDQPHAGIAAPEAAAELLRDPALDRIFDALDQRGDETRIVGGALRDALVGRPVREIDLATTASPDVVIERAQAAGLRTIPTGLAHGTVTVLIDGRAFEVTSLRTDVETDGRHAKVRFGRDFETDALRRDFTINALYLARDARLFDFVGGLHDIEAQKVRFIGDPEQRITEDYLRILRFFRFSAEFGREGLDAAGLLASIRKRNGLALLSRERVRAELFKLLCAKRAPEVVAEMCDAGLLAPLLAGAPNPLRLHIVVSDSGLATQNDPILRLAALCLYVQEDAERLRECLRLSKDEYRRLDWMARAEVALHARAEPPRRAELRALLYRFGRQASLDALALTQAGARASGYTSLRRAQDFLRTTPEPRFNVSGSDIMDRGVNAGPAVGRALKEIEARWIAAGLPEDPERLGVWLDDVCGRLQ